MKIKFTGSRHILRSVGFYIWNAENNFMLEIADGRFCADLLTANKEFRLAACEPLLTLMRENDVIELAIYGVGNLETLAALNSKGITRLAEETGKSVQELRAWVKQAQKLLEAENGKQTVRDL